MGIQEVRISFVERAATAIQRSQRGNVLLVVKDDTAGADIVEFNLGDSVNDSNLIDTNTKGFVNLAFVGAPLKVIVVKIATSETDLSDATALMGGINYDYAAAPEGSSAEMTELSNFHKAEAQIKKGKRCVVHNVDADSEFVINLTTTGIEVNGVDTSTAAFTARLAGVLAQLPMTQSVDGYEFTDVTNFTESTDPDADVEAGKFILGFVNNKVKPLAENNSLTTTTATKGEAHQSIKGVDTMSIIRRDIDATWTDNYQSVRLNSYSQNVAWHQAVQAYMVGLQQEGALDPDQPVTAGYDVDAKILYLQGRGVDTSTMSVFDIKSAPQQRQTFTRVTGTIGFTMGTLNFVMNLV